MKTGLKTKWGLFLVIVLVFFAGHVVLAERSWVCELNVTGVNLCDYRKNDVEEKPSAIVVSDIVKRHIAGHDKRDSLR